MIEMHSKYDNMHINVMFYALNCINNHVLSCLDCMLSENDRNSGAHASLVELLLSLLFLSW